MRDHEACSGGSGNGADHAGYWCTDLWTEQGPPDYAHFASCTYIWAKTFSCMEYMMGGGLCREI